MQAFECPALLLGGRGRSGDFRPFCVFDSSVREGREVGYVIILFGFGKLMKEGALNFDDQVLERLSSFVCTYQQKPLHRTIGLPSI